MTNDDKQAAVPFSLQDSSPELEEQTLEKITGGGGLKNLLKGCCSAPKTLESSPPPTSFGPTQTPGGGLSP